MVFPSIRTSVFRRDDTWSSPFVEENRFRLLGESMIEPCCTDVVWWKRQSWTHGALPIHVLVGECIKSAQTTGHHNYWFMKSLSEEPQFQPSSSCYSLSAVFVKHCTKRSVSPPGSINPLKPDNNLGLRDLG
jgi:hypothetical protein